MSDSESGTLTATRILTAAEEVVRRHGPSKATVCDVAAALGVSHGSIYRFFPSKVALREAVVEVWLNRISDALEKTPLTGTVQARLRGWFDAHWALKKAQKSQDPELFEAFRQLTYQAPAQIRVYRQRLTDQIAILLEAGLASGEIRDLEPGSAARALLNATTRFHNPVFAPEWDDPHSLAEFELLWSFLCRSIFLQGTCP